MLRCECMKRVHVGLILLAIMAPFLMFVGVDMNSMGHRTSMEEMTCIGSDCVIAPSAGDDCLSHCLKAALFETTFPAAAPLTVWITAIVLLVWFRKDAVRVFVQRERERWREGIGKWFLTQQLAPVMLRE